MPLKAEVLLSWEFEPIEQVLTPEKSMLYASSLGIGSDPLDEWALRFVYEKDLLVFPTMAVVIGHPGNWMADPRAGITRSHVLHGAQRQRLHRPLPIGSTVIATNRVADLIDRGERGAIMIIERLIHDKASGDLIATLESHVFCRADGGFGGSTGPERPLARVPERSPDSVVEFETRPDAAILYRLNGDWNPLHVDPSAAARAGFPRPIIHGLYTYGAAAFALLQRLGRDGADLVSYDARFSKPAFPGERLAVDIWDEGGEVAFQVRVPDRELAVLDSGRAVLACQPASS